MAVYSAAPSALADADGRPTYFYSPHGSANHNGRIPGYFHSYALPSCGSTTRRKPTISTQTSLWLSALVSLLDQSSKPRNRSGSSRFKSTAATTSRASYIVTTSSSASHCHSYSSRQRTFRRSKQSSSLHLQNMARKPSSTPSTKQQGTEFHMSTRRRSSQQSSATATATLQDSTTASSPVASASTRLTTPEVQNERVSSSSSPLSSALSSLGSTPEGLGHDNKTTEVDKQTDRLSGTSPSKKRKVDADESQTESSPDQSASKKRKVTSTIANQDAVEQDAKPRLSLEDEFKALVNSASNSDSVHGPRTRRKSNFKPEIQPDTDINKSKSGLKRKADEFDDAHQTPTKEPDTTNTESSGTASTESTTGSNTQPRAKKVKPNPRTRRKPPKNDLDLTHAEWKDKTFWPEYDPGDPIFYTADRVRTQPGSQHEDSATGSPKKRARNGTNNRRRGGGNGNGSNRGKGKGKGRNGREDSLEPPNKKRILTESDEEYIKKLKARQQELKRFFSVVGTHQTDILDQLATRDLSKMIRKSKAHKNVPEYHEVIQDLESLRDETYETIRKKHALQVEHEKQRYEQEKEIIEANFLLHCKEAKIEHQQGVAGDMALLKKAHAAAEDETRTEAGSEIDYFPRYHELPESDARVRGYTSNRIIDEKSLKQYLESYDDQARQEVMDEDFIRPMIESINQRNREHREDLEFKKTQNMESLSEEAIKRLNEMGGYLIERPMKGSEQSAYALSALADVSEYMAQQHPQKQYIFMPLAPGEPYPLEVADKAPIPIQRQLAPAPQIGSAPPSAALPPVSTPVSATIVPPPPLPPTSRSRTQSYTQMNGVSHTTPAIVPPPPPHQIISQGPGQVIAPAPPKSKAHLQAAPPAFSSLPPPPPPPPSQQTIFRHSQPPNTGSGSQRSSSRSRGSQGHQQFSFLPPQQPQQHQSASPLSPSGPASATSLAPPGSRTMSQIAAGTGAALSSSSPGGAGGTSGGAQQSKMPVTFVNQTIASRKAAAAAAAAAATNNTGGQGGASSGGNGSGAGKGGQRMLLPKV